MNSNISNISDIRGIIKNNIVLLENNYKVKNIGIFGSVARNESKKNSDIDILVEFFEPIGFFKFIELEEFLSQILAAKIDLVTKKALKPRIKEEILQETIYV